ncbi:MAG: S-methyl-5-thioribose-1-phosphate isomerase [Methylotetracoccus sp.]
MTDEDAIDISDAHDSVRALRWTDEGLMLLDQRLLPDRIAYQLCATADDTAEAIATMRVRGAPAIGIAAAYGAVLSARAALAASPESWRDRFDSDLRRLAASRPTAVNLFWAIDRMRKVAAVAGDPLADLLAAAHSILADDVAANRRMGELGADLIAGASGVLTHCNTGSLATGGYGTALGVVRSTYRRASCSIYATETRPWLQGARLTLWELHQDRIPATLIADSAAAMLMRNGAVQWVVVGADRITANGDTANKIGTYSLAVLARHHGVRFMVVAPTSTIDWSTASGDGITVEERDQSELLPSYYRRESGPSSAWNPVFDVTPAELIDVIVTERGVVTRPSPETLGALRAGSGS